MRNNKKINQNWGKTLLRKKKLVFVSIVLIALICSIETSTGFMLNPYNGFFEINRLESSSLLYPYTGFEGISGRNINTDKQEINPIQLKTTTDHIIESQEHSTGDIYYSTDIVGLIKSDIKTKELDVMCYLKQNPDLIDEFSEIVKKKISANPELLADFEKLTKEVEFEITAYKLQSSVQISSMETMGLGWFDIIEYILKMFIPAKPGININYIVGQCERIKIGFTVDNADTIYGVTILSDGKIIGYVGDGWFTWPGSSKTFILEYNNIKCHKLEAFPTILKGIPKIRAIFTSSLSICIGSGSYIIMPEPEIIEIQPISIEVAPIQFEKVNINKINSPVVNIIGFPILEPIMGPLPPIIIQSD